MVNPPPEMLKMLSEISQRVLSPEDHQDLKMKAGLP
jgi:hypothetical protein